MRLANDANLPPYTGQDIYQKNLSFRLLEAFRKIATQLNGISEGKIESRHSAVASMPTTGTYRSGDYVPKTSFSIAGGAGSQYVVKGWNRITDGSSHVLNTDWTEDRALTGS